MPSAFDDLMQEARDAGVDPDWVDRVEKASAGSPLRRERDEARQQLEKAIEDSTRFRSAALGSQFKELGIEVEPAALNIPSDLDPLDQEKVREWAVGMKLAKPPEPAVPPEQEAQYEQLATAAEGATPIGLPNARNEVLATNSYEEFLAKGRAAGLVK